MSIPTYKVCKGCKVNKPAAEYSKQLVKRPYGTLEYLHPYCKPCACKNASANWKKKPKKPRKRALLPEHSKVCRECGIEKPTEDFGTVKKGRGDRLNRPSRCKPCRTDHVREYNKRVRESDPEKHALNFKRWAKSNKAHLAAKANKRRTSKLRATPAWLSMIDIARMGEFYEIAAAKTVQTGVCHEVDHIVPLKGKTVRGLHVPWNLQVLTESENASKRNKLLEVT